MYIELIFIVNFLLDYMILYGTKRLLNRKNKNKRLLLGSILGSSTTIFLFINITNIKLIIIKIFISILMNLTSFGKKEVLKNTFYFYLISITLAGSIYLLDLTKIKDFYFIILIVITPIIIKTFITEWNNYKLIEKNKYDVKIYYKHKEYNLTGFIDSGNRLSSPINNKPIILVNLEIKPNKIIYVPYNTIDSSGIITCFKPDKIIIEEQEINNCLIGLVKDKIKMKNINCILPNKIKEIIC
ncbi:MAG: sigma-E processing peptidase SpoIIGA [Bacilli bacterium]|nr:sigma-E processing peptidase SpoIIGA [Bacilli bacterium]